MARSKISIESLGFKVCEYWNKESGWNWRAFSDLLLSSTLLKLDYVSLFDDQEEEEEDSLLWRGEPDQTLLYQQEVSQVVLV